MNEPITQRTEANERSGGAVSSPISVEVIAGPNRGATFTLAYGRYRVGKHRDCDLALHDLHVSRVHLEIEVSPHGIHVRDLGSRNGSFCKGVRFCDLHVPLGASIVVGKSRLRFRAGARTTEARFGGLVARSRPMRDLFAKLERIAASDANLLIDGETGTGKEVTAAAVHCASARRAQPFVVVDLAAVPRNIIESELFGHVRGAFTGADRDREGAFALANGGTIVLDEIGELPLDAQPVLLRVIENRTIQPIGAGRPIPIDVRIIANTNRDLAREVEHRRFRADLYFRLSTFRVTLPPLRDRREDIPLLVEQMLGECSGELADAEIAALCEHDWPGNIRELRNELERVLAFSDRANQAQFCAVGTEPDLASAQRFREARASWERRFLTRTLARTEGNVSRAAREAGLGRTQMYQLMKKYGI